MKKKYLKKIITEINQKANLISRPLTFMELCGTHSQTVARFALKDLLPKNIKLVSGPGCPVCVTDQSDIDAIIALAQAGIPIATYGDVLKVPGTITSLEKILTQGKEIFVVYDVTDALKLQNKKPNLVFFGIGFETTAPMTAWAIKKGLTVYSAHKSFFPAMQVLFKNKFLKIDGFINPGHVSAVTGIQIYKKLKISQVIAGFEANDVLQAISMLLDQIISRKYKVENEYTRVVKSRGNLRAQRLITKIFEKKDVLWRGLGKIKKSGFKIRKKYKKQDAEYIYANLLKKNTTKKEKKSSQPLPCLCEKILQGISEPHCCPLFSKICQPDTPYGPCMASVEGTCNIEYRYGKKK